ncbi:MAG: ribosome small subunit-dependent GTPase A [Myxococcaceae bacterium]
MNPDLPGWSPALATAFECLQSQFPSLVPGRVVRQDSQWLRVATNGTELLARASGRLEHEAQSPLELPVIGDWVALREPAAPTDRTFIEHVLPRRSLLARRGRDDGREGQAIAANADTALLVIGLDRAPNVSWLRRAMTLVWDGGARPLVVLNKADLVDLGEVLPSVSVRLPGVDLLPVSARTGQGLAELMSLLPRGETAVLLGTSGVGKSSLVNRLLGDEVLATAEVRERDARGRHTTTHRELRLLANGAQLIDGPGMRELGLWDSDEGLGSAFPDVQALAAACRFRDCQHRGEPGCAVEAASADGTLDPERLESYQKLRREQRWLEATATTEGRAELKRRARTLRKAAWALTRGKRRGE